MRFETLNSADGGSCARFLLRAGQGVLVRHRDHIAQDGGIYGGKPGENPRVIRVVVGEEVRVGIGFDQRVAIFDRAAEDERVVILAQADEERAVDFQRGSAIRNAIFDAFERVRELANAIKRGRRGARSDRPRRAGFFSSLVDFVGSFLGIFTRSSEREDHETITARNMPASRW